ncbi:MAG TPA: excinuclease ABC subunit UvrB [Clostridiales bacterium]|nr:excinuclease ABC subunit UvrB [Clostridiales bacterium]
MIKKDFYKFELESKFSPSEDQQKAVDILTKGINDGEAQQILLGVTGSGKTFTMANIIKNFNKPTLVIAHNKTLAAQLCNEFRALFPKNRVEYFVSYYDYYQPEAYIPRTDTYIDKEIQINEEIDKLRNSATASLGERNDVIIVASVSCIYGLGAPEIYFKQSISVREGDVLDRDELIDKLVDIQYSRSDIDFRRSTFRVRGDRVEVFPAGSSDKAIRIDFWGDEIESISEFNPVTNQVTTGLSHYLIFPATHYVIGSDNIESVLEKIKEDMLVQEEFFKSQGKLIEAQRIRERVNYDIEMIAQMGYCNGIENYSRYFDGRSPGEAPYTLLDYFSDDFLVFIDESHMTIPQIKGMYNGDFSRKTNLVEYGFRLPAAFDNRPLKFAEFEKRIKQAIFVSATPGDYELGKSKIVAEQIIRPTGLVDPEIIVRQTKGQIDDLLSEIHKVVDKGGRVLITTLTIRMSEELTNYLKERKIKVEYMHNQIDTLERIEIINRLRRGDIDVIVGINLLREGLDIPEVMLVAILDADKEGFLRSRTSLIQTVGRASRNANSYVIMYADTITKSMQEAITETNRRREIQKNYNVLHNITPKTIKKEIKNTLVISKKSKKEEDKLTVLEINKEIKDLYDKMNEASATYDFEQAIIIRDRITYLRSLYNRKNKKAANKHKSKDFNK